MKNIQLKSPITIISIISILGGLTYIFFPQIAQFGMSTLPATIEYRSLQFLLYSFIHGGILHTISNVIFFVFIGKMVEIVHGKSYIWGLWLWTTVLVGIVLMFYSASYTIGGSGFAMSLLTIYTLDFYKRKNPEYKTGIILITINIVIGLSGNISLLGHLSGTIAGFLYGVIVKPGKQNNEKTNAFHYSFR